MSELSKKEKNFNLIVSNIFSQLEENEAILDALLTKCSINDDDKVLLENAIESIVRAKNWLKL